MKKVILALGAVTVLLMTACVPPIYTTENSSTQTSSSSSTLYSSTQSTISPKPENNVILLHDNKSYKATNGKDEIELTCIGVFTCSEVRSNSTNQFAEYFSDILDETYVYMKLKIKNIGCDTVSDPVFKDIKLIFDNKYNYHPQQLNMESDTMSQFWSLEPLKYQDVWFVASIPDEIVNKGFEFSFSVGNTTFEFQGSPIEIYN